MKFRYLLLFPLLIPSAAYAVTADDIAPYVYPANAAKAPSTVTYLADGKNCLALADDNTKIVKYDIKSGKEIEVVLDAANTRDNQVKRIAAYELSPDESKILIYEKSTPVYRRSFKAEYYIYEIRHNVLSPLSTEHRTQQSPIWSPDGRMVAFVSDNNIYLRKLDYNTEVAVTTDGRVNEVINGVPDWTYEEEFSTNCSMTWAPDNLTLCYLKYNESNVPLYSFPLYQGTCDPMNQYALYPGAYTYKYPVAGEPNSIVTLHSYDVETRKTKNIELSDSRIEYITAPGTMEGGDVMMVGNHFYIGLSARTNEEGCRQFLAALEKHGHTGSVVPLEKVLHLKTGLAYLEDNNLLVAGEFCDKEEFARFN
ncbi:arginine deiminase family protein, partial [uncultured Muribaculum sp.]|uniref:arginine deiminase family protein n=1 Tax=uncultured Muribaculum sp. TaxID=1918613 RepID=UPI0025B754F6